ncbi:RNA polymerase I specific transcription initiation factor [Phlyctema vagabunda]|uniref:RNA polymerase I specific transcription initiation factor n=1 Tax=Phlyctema vagabunda TaxID=108571 RepID=A0ABR4P433_9HELO
MFEHDSYDEPYGSENSDQTRRNQYDGPRQTWQYLARPERDLKAFLEQIHTGNLSLHLYDAHASKRRAREHEKSRKRKQTHEPGTPADDDGNTQESFVPRKAWTAWPLPPDRVPREDEQHQDPEYALPSDQRPSGGLEEELVAVSLRFARNNFEARKWKEADDESEDEETNKKELDARALDDITANPVQIQEQPMAQMLLKQSSEAPAQNVLMRPVISADDEISRELLQPSVRHTLMKLDQVLMALHHARESCYKIYETKLNSRFDQTGGNLDPESFKGERSELQASDHEETVKLEKPKPVGRSPLYEGLPTHSQSAAQPDQESSIVLRPKLGRMGRPRKQYKRFDGETEEEHLIRVARMQKKPIPSFNPPKARKATKKDQSPRKANGRKHPASEKAMLRWEKHLHPRDWSDVVGSAALVGFAPEVIARATQRCANLFGEDMKIRHMAEVPVMVTNEETLKNYVPRVSLEDQVEDRTTIDLSSASDSASDSAFEDEGSDTNAKGSKATFLSRRGRKAKVEIYFCPVAECYGSIHGFATPSGVQKHVRRVHGPRADEIENSLYGGHREMDGAVHVDGFMKPILFREVGRGKDVGERKKGRWLEPDAGAPESSSAPDLVDKFSSDSEHIVKSEPLDMDSELYLI